jgi:hypothetical protein
VDTHDSVFSNLSVLPWGRCSKKSREGNLTIGRKMFWVGL